MSLDPRFNTHHSDEVLEVLKNLDDLEQVAAAAGHGYSRDAEHNAGWVELSIDPENVRPSYDLNYIRTFSPDLIAALLFELSEARKALAQVS